MCGLTGYAQALTASSPLEGMEVLRRMTSTLSARGPDAEGYRHSAQVAMGHRRLIVIDPQGGPQPMHDSVHGLTVVYNGELYNYLELNSELEGLGFSPKTRSDTETLLLAYAAWGEGCLERLNGMYAFVIHDERRRRLFGARDRLGKKPLSFVHSGSFFAFASEPKALLQHPRVVRASNPEAMARYLLLEHDYQTLITDHRPCPPATDPFDRIYGLSLRFVIGPH